MTRRTKNCSEIVRAGRLRKATEFHDAGALVEDVAPDAAGELYVMAGIAAADAICCKRLGVHAIGENHTEAIKLLEDADRTVARHLQTLLVMKTKVAYTHQSISSGDLKKAGRAASKLLEAARRIANPNAIETK